MARRTEDYEAKDADGSVYAVVTSEQLAYEPTEDLLPEVMILMSSAFDRVAGMVAAGKINGTEDVMALLPALGGFISQLQGGKLKQLAPRLLASTTVTMALTPGGEKLRFDLCKKDERASVFESRPELYFPTLYHAGRVTFGRFFPAIGRGKKPSPTAP